MRIIRIIILCAFFETYSAQVTGQNYFQTFRLIWNPSNNKLCLIGSRILNLAYSLIGNPMQYNLTGANPRFAITPTDKRVIEFIPENQIFAQPSLQQNE